MEQTKRAKLTYKTLFRYSLVIIGLLLLGMPLFLYQQSSFGLPVLPLEATASGQSPKVARPLAEGINVDQLAPGAERWYLYRRPPEGASFSVALRYESEAIFDPQTVNFQIMSKMPHLFQSRPDELIAEGTLALLGTTQQNVAELFWRGPLNNERNHYFVRVFNNAPLPLDYTLEATMAQQTVPEAIPASFGNGAQTASAPAAAVIPQNARQLRWTLAGRAVTNMEAPQAATWMKQAQAVGWLAPQGVDTNPDLFTANPDMLWMLVAQALEGQPAESATQWLLEADSLGWLAIPPATLKDFNTEFVADAPDNSDDQGPSEAAAVPAPPQEIEPQPYQPVSIYPNNPLPFDLGNVNSGRLAPYGEHWYSLILSEEKDNELIEDLQLTMFTTPSNGFIDSRVNFEIFPASQYHIWLRGDSDYMESFGLGMWLSRDEDANTGERLWSGSVVDGDRYFIKVKNASPEVIDYYLYPDDVENAELGNPILHQADEQGDWAPYSLSPPTRPLTQTTTP